MAVPLSHGVDERRPAPTVLEVNVGAALQQLERHVRVAGRGGKVEARAAGACSGSEWVKAHDLRPGERPHLHACYRHIQNT
eukprot:5037208-Pleurochrysis_carterae.AAC.1